MRGPCGLRSLGEGGLCWEARGAGGGLGRREWPSSAAGFADRRLSLPQHPAGHEASSRLGRSLIFPGALWETSRVRDPLYTSHVHKQGWHSTGSQGTRGTEQLGPRQTGLPTPRSGSPSPAWLGDLGVPGWPSGPQMWATDIHCWPLSLRDPGEAGGSAPLVDPGPRGVQESWVCEEFWGWSGA